MLLAFDDGALLPSTHVAKARGAQHKSKALDGSRIFSESRNRTNSGFALGIRQGAYGIDPLATATVPDSLRAIPEIELAFPYARCRTIKHAESGDVANAGFPIGIPNVRRRVMCSTLQLDCNMRRRPRPDFTLIRRASIVDRRSTDQSEETVVKTRGKNVSLPLMMTLPGLFRRECDEQREIARAVENLLRVAD